MSNNIVDIQKPYIHSIEQIILLIKKLYGIETSKITQLNAYDDKNYHVIVSRIDNQYISTPWVHGYTLKIMNSLDSKNINFVEAQNHLMLYVAKHGINTTEPENNIYGEYYSVEPLKTKEGDSVNYHVIRLLKYQPGILLKNMSSLPSVLPNLFHDVGQKAGALNNIMKEFHHDGYNDRETLWSLKNAVKIKEFLFAVKENEKVSMVLNVLEEFEETVIKKLNILHSGLIHGDLNEQNILVEKYSDCLSDEDDKKGYKVCAILDYGDTHVSAYILELATMMCYMLLMADDLEAGTYVLEGYNKLNPLPIEEYKLLPICVSARLCQSLVLGIYSHSLDPENHYVLSTQAAGWKILHKIRSTDSDSVYKLWMKNIIKCQEN
ncbi:hydroxylysine kinase [Lycorma delicatula]|uniref:hydroxylysine kinase n=1 Tax=Lycorma delicatula TaxID=130591 RepID=UPI003F510C29